MSVFRNILCGFLGWSLVVPAFLASEIGGRILITKALTKKRVTLPAYQMRSAALPLRRDEGKAVNEFERLVIFLEDPRLKHADPVQTEVVQENLRFLPDFVVVPLGSTVSFPNSDPVFHNVFSLSKVREFDLGYYPAGQTRKVTFNQPGIVQVYCHLHSHMNAAILVAPNAWYTRPRSDGTFLLSEVPPGVHTVVVWHKSAGFFKRKVELSTTGTETLDFSIPVRQED
jgi:plastocyanin